MHHFVVWHLISVGVAAAAGSSTPQQLDTNITDTFHKYVLHVSTCSCAIKVRECADTCSPQNYLSLWQPLCGTCHKSLYSKPWNTFGESTELLTGVCRTSVVSPQNHLCRVCGYMRLVSTPCFLNVSYLLFAFNNYEQNGTM